MLEALDHDPLQAVAEHGFHRDLEPGRYLEQVGHGADHAARAAPTRRRRRSRARPRRSPRAPAPAGRAPRARTPWRRRSREARRPTPAPRLARCSAAAALGLDVPQLGGEQRELDSGLPPRHVEPGARLGEASRPPRAPGASSSTSRSRRRSTCRPPLSQLAARASRARRARPRRGSARAAATRGARGDRGGCARQASICASISPHPPPAIGVARAGLPEIVELVRPARAPGTDAAPRAPPISPSRRTSSSTEIADLRPHLLPPLQEALRLALDLLHGLAQVARAGAPSPGWPPPRARGAR